MTELELMQRFSEEDDRAQSAMSATAIVGVAATHPLNVCHPRISLSSRFNILDDCASLSLTLE